MGYSMLHCVHNSRGVDGEMFLSLCLIQPGCIVSASWPVSQPIDEILVKSSSYLMETIHDFRKRMKAFTETKKVSSSLFNC